MPRNSNGALSPDTAAARLAITRAKRSEYGRAASAAACARFSFDAATICNALVIFCVLFTLAIRLRNSFKLGIEILPLRKRQPAGHAHEEDADGASSQRTSVLFKAMRRAREAANATHDSHIAPIA